MPTPISEVTADYADEYGSGWAFSPNGTPVMVFYTDGTMKITVKNYPSDKAAKDFLDAVKGRWQETVQRVAAKAGAAMQTHIVGKISQAETAMDAAVRGHKGNEDDLKAKRDSLAAIKVAKSAAQAAKS
jgi:hypothetical protein